MPITLNIEWQGRIIVLMQRLHKSYDKYFNDDKSDPYYLSPAEWKQKTIESLVAIGKTDYRFPDCAMARNQEPYHRAAWKSLFRRVSSVLSYIPLSVPAINFLSLNHEIRKDYAEYFKYNDGIYSITHKTATDRYPVGYIIENVFCKVNGREVSFSSLTNAERNIIYQEIENGKNAGCFTDEIKDQKVKKENLICSMEEVPFQFEIFDDFTQKHYYLDLPFINAYEALEFVIFYGNIQTYITDRYDPKKGKYESSPIKQCVVNGLFFDNGQYDLLDNTSLISEEQLQEIGNCTVAAEFYVELMDEPFSKVMYYTFFDTERFTYDEIEKIITGKIPVFYFNHYYQQYMLYHTTRDTRYYTNEYTIGIYPQFNVLDKQMYCLRFYARYKAASTKLKRIESKYYDVYSITKRLPAALRYEINYDVLTSKVAEKSSVYFDTKYMYARHEEEITIIDVKKSGDCLKGKFTLADHKFGFVFDTKTHEIQLLNYNAKRQEYPIPSFLAAGSVREMVLDQLDIYCTDYLSKAGK